MRALVCHSYGPPDMLAVAEMPAPVVGAGQLLIEVHAAGVNFPDTLIIQNKYQRRVPVPFIPGSELAGIVREVGPGVDGFRRGDRVLAYTIWGAFADLAVADAGQAMPIPDGVDFVTAAGFMLASGTALYALEDRAQLQPGETLLVLGAAGGVGSAAIEAGKALGATVIAAASSAEKLALCRDLGADILVNYGGGDLRQRLREAAPETRIDVILDPAGGAYSEPAMREIGWGGRFLVVGFAAGEIPRVPLNLPLVKNFSIIGVVWGQFVQRAGPAAAHLQRLVAMLQDGRLRPRISAVYPLERASEAIAAMADRRALGKLVIDLRPGTGG